MAYRLQRDVAKELGIDQNELRFLIQWLIGESRTRESIMNDFTREFDSHVAGQTRLIDDPLYNRLKIDVPIFKNGREFYRKSPVQIAKVERVE